MTQLAQVAVAAGYGGPGVVKIVSEQTRPLAAGEVLLDVRAIGVNPIDAKAYSGIFGTDEANLPIHLGAEAAGVVLEVGPGVSAVAVGDEVIAYPASGAYTSKLVVPESSLTPKPVELGWAEAAGLMLAGATAVHTLTAAGVGADDTVLIHGASGGVGLFAVQLAVARGATVIGTASVGAHDLLTSLGVTPVVYGEGLADRVRDLAPAGVDAAIDTVGTDEAVETSLELVADRSRIATIAAFGRAVKDGIKLLGVGPGADPGADIRGPARAELAELAGAGKLTVFVAATYPLTDVASAHVAQVGSHAPGKIVLIP